MKYEVQEYKKDSFLLKLNKTSKVEPKVYYRGDDMEYVKFYIEHSMEAFIYIGGPTVKQINKYWSADKRLVKLTLTKDNNTKVTYYFNIKEA